MQQLLGMLSSRREMRNTLSNSRICNGRIQTEEQTDSSGAWFKAWKYAPRTDEDFVYYEDGVSERGRKDGLFSKWFKVRQLLGGQREVTSTQP